jgi:hypothetical protein
LFSIYDEDHVPVGQEKGSPQKGSLSLPALGKRSFCRRPQKVHDEISFFREPLSAKSFLPQAALFAMMFFGDRRKNGIFSWSLTIGSRQNTLLTADM